MMMPSNCYMASKKVHFVSSGKVNRALEAHGKRAVEAIGACARGIINPKLAAHLVKTTAGTQSAITHTTQQLARMESEVVDLNAKLETRRGEVASIVCSRLALDNLLAALPAKS